MRTWFQALLSLCLLVAFASASPAATSIFQSRIAGSLGTLGTPDGLPPSVEVVCNGYTGAAYGLCTAYCEAMDCDSPAPQASARACDRVILNFTRITGAGLPCDCPCIGRVPGFAEALTGPVEISMCVAGGDHAEVYTANGQAVGAFFYAGGGICGVDGAGLRITQSQCQVCMDLIRQAGARSGLVCGGGYDS